MVNPIPERPALPRPPRGSPPPITQFLSDLIRTLTFTLTTTNTRLNQMLPKDGTERMLAALPLLTVTVATLPTAADHEGGIIYVSDGAGGAKFRGSDGTSWVNLG